MTTHFFKQLGCALALTAVFAPGIAHAELLADADPLMKIQPGVSRIEVVRSTSMGFPEGAFIGASWTSECDGEILGPKAGKDAGWKLNPGDYFTMDSFRMTEYDVLIDVTLYKKGAQTPETRIELECARVISALAIGHPEKATVADLRRALGWDVWVSGALKSDTPDVAQDVAALKTAPPAPAPAVAAPDSAGQTGVR